MPPKRVKTNPPPSSAAQRKISKTRPSAQDAPNADKKPLSAVRKTEAVMSPSLTSGLIKDSDSKGKRKAEGRVDIADASHDEDEDEDEEEDEMEWEDVFQTAIEPALATNVSSSKKMDDLELILENNKPEISM